MPSWDRLQRSLLGEFNSSTLAAAPSRSTTLAVLPCRSLALLPSTVVALNKDMSCPERPKTTSLRLLVIRLTALGSASTAL